MKVFTPELSDDGLFIVATTVVVDGNPVASLTVTPDGVELNWTSTLVTVYPAAFDPVEKPWATSKELKFDCPWLFWPILLTSTAADTGEANANTTHAQPNNN